MSGEYTIRCDAVDYTVETGVCAAPYYAMTTDSMWSMTIEQGVAWSGAIVGLWLIGLAARVLIRTAREAMKH